MSRRKQNLRAFLHNNPNPTIEEAWDSAWTGSQKRYHSKTMQAQQARIDRLQAMIHEAREVYAGMEGFEPETATEGYCLRIIEQMVEALRESEDG